jgi:hypothetical protein
MLRNIPTGAFRSRLQKRADFIQGNDMLSGSHFHGRLRHAKDHGTGLVLNNRHGSSLVHGQQARCSIAAHSRQDKTNGTSAALLGDGFQQNIPGRSHAMQGLLLMQTYEIKALAPENFHVKSTWREECKPWNDLITMPSFSNFHTAKLIELRREKMREERRHMLDNDDSGALSRQFAQNLFQGLCAPCRRCDRDDFWSPIFG